MRQFRWIILLAVAGFGLPGCAVKGYVGPELAADRLATVSLKTPDLAKIPLFWIFPLTILPWTQDDWFETSWSADIKLERVARDDTAGQGRLSYQDVSLNRYVSVSVEPDYLRISRKSTQVVDESPSGFGSVSTGPCSCSGGDNTDKSSAKNCQRSITTTTPYRVSTQDTDCWISFLAKAGVHYQAFVRNGELSLQNSADTEIATASCAAGQLHWYDTDKTESTSMSC